MSSSQLTFTPWFFRGVGIVYQPAIYLSVEPKPLRQILRYRNSFIDVDDQDGDMTGGSQASGHDGDRGRAAGKSLGNFHHWENDVNLTNKYRDTLWLCQNSYWKWPIYSEFSH